MEAKDAQALYEEAQKIRPRWGEKGSEVETRRERAVDLLKQAARMGHTGAIQALAEGMDGEAAFEWAVELAKLGDDDELVSALTSSDWPVEKCRAVLESARAGEAWAELAVGNVYWLGMADGEGVLVATMPDGFGWLPAAKDPSAEGERWIERAVARGWAAASMRLGDRMRRRDPERATGLLRAALAEGGVLTAEDRDRCRQWLVKHLDAIDAPLEERVLARRALAEQGHVDSMVWLGDAHRTGKGAPKDLSRAREWYEAAAKHPSAEACRELGKLYEYGRGVRKDLDKARAYYESAAELGGDAYARERLVKTFGLTWYAKSPGER